MAVGKLLQGGMNSTGVYFSSCLIHTPHFREPLKHNLHSKFSGLPVPAGKEEDDKRVDEKVA